jgi:hypothetical protein
MRRVYRPMLTEFEPRQLLSGSVDVLTWHNDNARTGQNLDETTLTPSNVNAATFGKLFTDPVDGAIYAQPLVMTNLAIPGQGTHDVVFVATENDSVYAFDADNPGVPLWHDSFIDPAAGITPIPTTQAWQDDLNPEVGITGTPVIDPTTDTLYVVSKVQVTTAAGTSYVMQLHALDVTTGAEKMGGPVTIQATVPGRGAGHVGKTVSFQAEWEIQRPGLLLENGVVYVAFSSLGDFGPYHGWVIGYNASNLQPVAVFNDTPNSNDRTHNLGGIWMAGGGLAADPAGWIYLLTGSGEFNPRQGSYSDAALKLSPTLQVADYYAPTNTTHLDQDDLDLGSGGVILAPSVPGGLPNTLIGGGKDGTLDVLNTASLGGQKARNKNLQAIANPSHGIFSTAAYSNGFVYIQAVGDVLRQYVMINGKLFGPIAESSTSFGYPGATPSISSNNGANGIVWEIEHTGTRGVTGPAVLHAYNALNVSQQLYSSTQAGARDALGTAVKFTPPTIANGKVYVATATGLSVFGEL